VAIKKIGLDVNADKSKYIVISRDKRVGRSHSVKAVDNSFDRVEEFKCLGTTHTYLITHSI
jgi:hypothetical protein